jgi:hypothetical protein
MCIRAVYGRGRRIPNLWTGTHTLICPAHYQREKTLQQLDVLTMAKQLIAQTAFLVAALILMIRFSKKW